MKEERIRFLLERYVEKTISQEGLDELAGMLRDPQYKPVVEAFMNEQYEGLSMMKEVDVDWETMYQKVLSEKSGAKVYTMERRRSRAKMWGWVAAAAVLFVVCGLWFVVGRKGNEQPSIAVGTKVQQDIEAPKGTRAVIVLGDGRKVYLDSAGNGLIAQESSVRIVRNAKGEIVYEAARQQGDQATRYNTFFNPRGSRVIPLSLSDGTKVWLNSESSIKYPIAFSGKERIVEITGEAYFEVAPSISPNGGGKRPFIVSVNDMQVEVLGTHFNINSYSDEGAMKTTLLEGKVRVTRNGNIAVLKPGQQSVSMADGELTINNDVDVANVMAWKEGFFEFDNLDLAAIGRQLARWYDVKVEIGQKSGETYGGRISRDLNLSAVVKLLQENGARIRLEDGVVKIG